jgi:lysophospholipase L1-like esterase
LYSIELDPLGLSSFQEEPYQQSSDKPIVVFFGDSRAQYWPNPALIDYTFINRGIGNQTSAQVVNRFNAHVNPLQPEIVIIQVCINDIKTIPLFSEMKQKIITNCKANIQQIVTDTLELNATAIVTTVFQPTKNVPLARRLAWSDEVYNSVDEVNAFIRNMDDKDVLVFNSASLLLDNDGKTKPEYSNDLLHLNETGYIILNRELEKILSELK